MSSIFWTGKALMDPNGLMAHESRDGKFDALAINPDNHTAYWVEGAAGWLAVSCRMPETLPRDIAQDDAAANLVLAAALAAHEPIPVVPEVA